MDLVHTNGYAFQEGTKEVYNWGSQKGNYIGKFHPKERQSVYDNVTKGSHHRKETESTKI